MGYHFLNLDPAPDLQQAEISLLRAVEIDNSQAIAFVNLAQLYDLMGEPEKVIQMYRLAAICEPGNFRVPEFEIRHIDIKNTMDDFQGFHAVIPAGIVDKGHGQPVFRGCFYTTKNLRNNMGRGNKIYIMAPHFLQEKHDAGQLIV